MRNTHKLRAIWLSTVFVGVTAYASGALAQDDEIVVTATKRAESLQDVPIAVTAVSDEQLERKGIQDLTALNRAASGFLLNSSQSETQGTVLRIRGVGTTGNNIGLESSVGVFLDGVYLSRPGVALADLVDVEQIEVLRGPQGTLFGRNTSAGALNITTKKPDLNEIEASAAASYGNYNSANFQGGLSIPIVQDAFAIRLSGAVRQRDGIVDSTAGPDFGTRDRYLVRGQAYWAVSDAADLRLIVDYSNADEECCDAAVIRETPLATAGPGAFTLVGLGAQGGVFASGPGAVEDRLTNSQVFHNGAEQWGISGELNWDLGGANLTYVGAYRDFSSAFVQDIDFSGLNAIQVGRGGFAAPGTPESGDDIKSMTHELRLQGEGFGGKLDWLIGGYYSDESIDEIFTVTLGPDFQSYISANVILAPGVFAGFGPNPMLAFTTTGATFAGPYVSAAGNFASNHYSQDAQSFSFFTHDVISLTDWFDLTVGLRFVDETKDGAYDQLAATPFGASACGAVIANAPPGPPASTIPAALATPTIGLTCFPFAVAADSPAAAALPLPRTFSNTFEDDELIYTFNGNFHLSDEVSAYASYTHGFKSGGFNLDSTAAVGGADPRFRSEKINAYEIGLKATLFDGRVRANLAGFHYKMSDFQVLEFTGVQFNTFNVPEALSTGAEAEIDAELADFFSLNVGLTYADSRYPSDCNAGLPASTPANLAVSVLALCGSQLTGAPKFVGVFGGTFDTTVSDSGWGLFLTASARHESSRRTGTLPVVVSSGVILGPNPFDIQDANTKIDVRAGLRSPDERWSFEVWSNNLTDETTRFVTFNVPLRGTGANSARGAFLDEPRTWGVTVRAKF